MDKMSEHDFVMWLKGFVEGVHHYNVSPAQWDYLKETLAKVTPAEESSNVVYTIPTPEYTTTVA